MKIVVCPNCGILFDMDKQLIFLHFGHIDCPCCEMAIKYEDYERPEYE